MSSFFAVSVELLDSFYHGRRDDGVPEWPPSPLRVFQALVAAAARANRGAVLNTEAGSALSWLESLAPPTVVAPRCQPTIGYFTYLPNNAMDIVARAWCRGVFATSGDASPAAHRTAKKAVRPLKLLDGNVVHYLWAEPDSPTSDVLGYIRVLSKVARSIAALGWGIDMAVGTGRRLAAQEVEQLNGQRWAPHQTAGGDGLRVPAKGTLNALAKRYEGFLQRIGPSGEFTPPPLLAEFTLAEYRRESDVPSRHIAAFSLLKTDASGFRPFDACRRGLTVAGMMRFVTKEAALQSGWSEAQVGRVVLGHGEQGDSPHQAVGPERFSFLPLPTIESRAGDARVVGNIRRVLLLHAGSHGQSAVAWARSVLSGAELVRESDKEPVALLSVIPTTDRVVAQYTLAAESWTSVTPVVLPGFDDPNHYRRRLEKGVDSAEQHRLLSRIGSRIDGLIRKALLHAGLPEVLCVNADLEWNRHGYMRGVSDVERYGVPDHLRRFPRVHVKVTFRDREGLPTKVCGPLCIGGGRFMGLGLLVGLP